MSVGLGVILIILGIVVAVTVSWLIGILMVAAGAIILIVPAVSGRY